MEESIPANIGIEQLVQEAIRNRSNTELDTLIEFEAFSGQAEGKSARTIELTALALGKLRRYVVENRLPTDAALIEANDIRAFILHLKTSHRFSNHPYARTQAGTLSSLSVNSYLRAIRAAWNRWLAEGLVKRTPFETVRVPKATRKIIPTFSQGQIDALLAAADVSTPEGFRDRLLVLTYLDTMCRLTEATNLRMTDMDLKGRCLKVLGKGRRERTVPFGVVVQKLLWKYVNLHRPEPALPGHNYVFLTFDGRRLTKNRVEAIFKKLGRRAGIQGVRCSPHTLRHTACVLWIRNGGDVF